MEKQTNNVAGYIILTIGIIVSAIVLSYGFGKITDKSEVITVKGYAEMQIKSDYAIWNIVINSRSYVMSETYSILLQNKSRVLDFLSQNGFGKDEVEESSINNFTLTDYETNVINGYSMNQTLTIKSNDLVKIQKLSKTINNLLSEGIDFNSNPPEYYISDLGKYKVQMLGIALKDAQKRAEEIAKSVGNKVGGIKSARQGIFQITPLHSTEISDWGMNDVSSVEKSIKSVVDASFYVK